MVSRHKKIAIVLGSAIACITFLSSSNHPLLPWTRYVAPPLVLPLVEGRSVCEGLQARYSTSVDVHECIEERRVPMVVNGFCRDISCNRFVQLASTYQGKRHRIGVITIDDRRSHPGHEVWTAYAKAHGYTYITLNSSDEKHDPLKMMQKDWATTGKLLQILDDPSFTHIDLFMYTELDQWPVRPLALLEPVFEQTGLVSSDRVMSVVSEYPCENIRNGGRFNMGNFLFRRDDVIRDIFQDLNRSESYHDPNQGGMPVWPARQGAFTVDVYPRHRRSIATLRSGCPLGSPFGGLVGHMTGGSIDPFFDRDDGRNLLTTVLRQCVLRHLETRDPRPCSVYPPWVKGKCLQCHSSLAVLRQPSQEQVTLEYDTCCGEDDSSLAVELLEKTADEIVARRPNVTSLNLGLLLLEPPRESAGV